MDGLRTFLNPVDVVTQGSAGALRSQKTQEAALGFEGLLWSQVLQTMRKSVTSAGLFGEEDAARGTFEYLFDQVVVEAAMKSGKSLGLAERLHKAAGSGIGEGGTT